MNGGGGGQQSASGEGSACGVSRLQLAVLGFAMAAVAAVVCTQLRVDLYGDEWGHTWPMVGAADFWTRLRVHGAFYPPLYFLLARGAVAVVGAPWAIRLPSVLFALATVALAPLAARSVWGPRAFLPAVGLVTLSPFVLEFAGEGRAYAQLIFFSLAFVWAYVSFHRREGRTAAMALVLAALGGCWSHYIFGLLPLAAGVHYLLSRRRISKLVLAVAGSLVLGALPLLYWKISSPIAETARNLQSGWTEAYFQVPNFLARLAVALNFGYNVFRLPPLDPARNVGVSVLRDNWLPAVLMAGALLGLGWSVVRLMRREAVGRMLAGLVGGVTATAVLASLAGGFLVREKHLAIVWGGVFLLLAPGILWLWGHWSGKLAVLAYFALCLISLIHLFGYPDEYSRRVNWRGLIESVREDARFGDRLVVFNLGISTLSLRPVRELPDGVPETRLKRELQGGEPLPEIARRLDLEVKGTIFLVVNETDRLEVDPSNRFISWMRQNRKGSSQMFGRNLILWRFSSRGHP